VLTFATPHVIGLAAPRTLDVIDQVADVQGQVSFVETPTKVEIVIGTDVLFAFDRADLTPEAQGRLADVAAAIREKATGPVRIDGYTDSLGDAGYNQRLSEQRAEAVRVALAGMEGLGAVQFAATGHGAADPVAPNANPDGSDNPAGRAKNRRVVVTFTKRG
jgi:outer membrane protein OmpA-like peptidoglycan-associated protein